MNQSQRVTTPLIATARTAIAAAEKAIAEADAALTRAADAAPGAREGLNEIRRSVLRVAALLDAAVVRPFDAALLEELLQRERDKRNILKTNRTTTPR